MRVRGVRLGIIAFAIGNFALLALSNHLLEMQKKSQGWSEKQWIEWDAARSATTFEIFVAVLFTVAVLYFVWWVGAIFLPRSKVASAFDWLHDNLKNNESNA